MTLPASARLLGALGLVPFVAGALVIWLASDAAVQRIAAFALAAYGAVIVSFLGGIHWGLSMRAGEGHTHFGWAVVPSLLGWAALLLRPDVALAVLAAALVACYVVDRRLYAAAGLQAWLSLRVALTAVAAASCLAGAAAFHG